MIATPRHLLGGLGLLLLLPIGGRAGDGSAHVLRSPPTGTTVREGTQVHFEWETPVLDRSATPPRPVAEVAIQATRGDAPEWETVLKASAAVGQADWVPTLPGPRIWVRLATAAGEPLSSPVDFRVIPVPSQVTLAGAFAFAVMSDGTLRYWGDQPDAFGTEKFEGNPYYVRRPTRVLREFQDVAQVAAGGLHAVLLRRDGTVYLWGAAHEYGSGEPLMNPLPIPEVGTGSFVAAGKLDSFVMDSGGRAWAFGRNASGSLGDGTNVPRHSPVRVPGLDGAVTLAIGLFHGLALMPDGTVRSWGWNLGGQLGDGTREDRLSPQTVPGLTGVRAIAASGTHSLALREDGTVWAWGGGRYGELGNGTNSSSPVPVLVDGLPRIADIAAGVFSSYALDASGRLYAWGANDYGDLGVGDREDRNVPVAIRRPRLDRIWADGRTVHALDESDHWYAWGLNYNNQVGDGTSRDRLRPRRINWK